MLVRRLGAGAGRRAVRASEWRVGGRFQVRGGDVGEAAPRTIGAGLATKYTPEDLVGRTVIVVINLKPAKLRGVVSEGMLLAAGEKAVEGLATLTAAVAPGTIVR